MSSDEIPNWFATNGLRTVFGLLMVVLGWYAVATLNEIKGDIRETAAGVQSLMQNRESTNARLVNVEEIANRNADRIRELERQVWQGRPSAQSSTQAPY